MKSQIHFDHLNFSVNNFKTTANWYKNIFNFEIVEEGLNADGTEWGIIKNGEYMLALHEHPHRKQYEGEDYHLVNHFSFRIEDRKEWETIMKKYKLKNIYSSPFVYPNSLSWYVKDPNGYKIEVSLWNNNKAEFKQLSILKELNMENFIWHKEIYKHKKINSNYKLKK